MSNKLQISTKKFFGKYDAIYAYGVTRVSTEEQNGLSPQTQRERIGHFCRANGWKMLGCFSDVGSAWHRKKCLERDGLILALDSAIAKMAEQKKNGLNVMVGVVTFDIDRFFRDTEFGLQWLGRLESEGSFLATVTDGVNTMNPTADARFLQTMLLAVAQRFSDKLSERGKMTWGTFKKRNKCAEWPNGYGPMGTQPAGWKIDNNGVRVPCEEELQIIAKVLEAVQRAGKDNGRWTRAAQILNDEGVPTLRAYRATARGREPAHNTVWTKYMVQSRWRISRPKKKRINRMDFVRQQRQKLYGR
jgi:DNA invertase Pin-like site-specific DNA recombinase